MSASGEKNPRAKVTWEIVCGMRRAYALNREKKKNEIRNSKKNRVSTHTLAADYDLSQSTVWNIVSGRTWKLREKAMEANALCFFIYQP